MRTVLQPTLLALAAVFALGVELAQAQVMIVRPRRRAYLRPVVVAPMPPPPVVYAAPGYGPPVPMYAVPPPVCVAPAPVVMVPPPAPVVVVRPRHRHYRGYRGW